MNNIITDGIIVVNKPVGITSRDVVNRLVKIFNTKKIGHTGTLDPLASGVLVCTIGKCTKLTEYLTSTYKSYKVSFVLGYETDTLDCTGKVLKTSSIICTEEEIINAIMSFVGKYDQEVPEYSAVKINGKKLYEYARNGEKVELPKRKVEITSINNLAIDNDNITFECTVSKGTYIRSLIRDIGRKLGSYATMTSLDRTKQGNFDISDAYSLYEIESGCYKILTPIDILSDLPQIEVDEQLFKKVSNGVQLSLNIENDYVVFTKNGCAVALYKKNNDKFRMFVMF